MGNSESQYSLQVPKGTSLILPGKQKPYSLKFRSTKEEVLSPHTWWKGGPGGSGYKARAVGRGCLSPQQRRGEPYVSRHYDYVTKGVKGSPNCRRWHDSPPGGGSQLPSENGCCPFEGSGRLDSRASGELNDHALNGHRNPERMPGEGEEGLEEQSSPRVVIKKDGSLRVEFTNTNSGLLLDEASGPVQLLKFSPTLESTPSLPGSSRGPEAHHGAPQPASTSITRTSKGSSLSSEGSWYDSPWGHSADLCDQDQSCSPSRTMGNSRADQLEAFGQQSPPVSISDLYRDPSMAATFPTAKDLSAQYRESPHHIQHRASFVSALDVPTEEECPEARQYSSYTLPCRKARPSGERSTLKKGSGAVRSRMRRLSDWTGSLSRKKRKTQEPRYKDGSEVFDSGVDGLTADTSSPSQVSSLWYPGGVGASRAQSAGALHHSNDALRQNIYENFMRELETGTGQGSSGGGGAGERRDPSTGTEEGESSSESAGGSLEQLDLLFEKEQGVVRRAGWLSFKPLLTLHKDRKLELVARRKWRQYWVTLKGCTLLFYETYGKSSCPEQELSPRYALLAEDSIVQAIPEHPKKENVFCLSNAYGDVYLFQAANQTDLENWVTAIHSASASLLAKRQGKEDTVRLLRSQTRALLQKIDMDSKMKKMAELQLSVVSDPKNRKAIENQIQQWEQNLEKFHMDLFRMRCYLASLQGSELPNPKSLLAVAGRPSKTALGRLGIFSVSSFHALICTRDEATLRRRCRSFSRGARSKRGLFSSLKGLDSLTKRSKEKRESVSQVFEGQSIGVPAGHIPNHCSSERLDALAKRQLIAPPEGNPWYSSLETPVCVNMPDSQSVTLHIKPDFLVSDILSLACKERHLDPSQHCLRVRRLVGQDTETFSPAPTDPLRDLVYEELEVFPLNVFTIQLSRPDTAVDFGFAVTGHVDGARKSHVYVSEVNPGGLAFTEGLRPGDEILVLNGTSVSNLDLGLIHLMFNHQVLHLLLRREEQVPGDHTSVWPDCDPWQPAPPPPSHCVWPIDMPSPQELPESSVASPFEVSQQPRPADEMEQLGQNVETVCSLYQTFPEGRGAVVVEGQRNPYSMEPLGPQVQKPPCPRHMSISERLCKVIQELVDTEKSYVKDLSCLFEIYLKPLQNETFLTLDEMDSLFGSLPEMLDFQRVFLQTLEERIASSPDFRTLETPEQFKKLLFSLGGSFLYYADHFKLYSGFCANHIKVQKVLERAKTDLAFKEFLDARNPTKQHSSTLESYLIKPVQRVLKYPLLLRELVSLTDTDSEEHYHLTEALKAMEKVASHINEMQKIYEDYGSVFDQLVAEQSGPEKEVTELSMGEFLMHSSVVWLNPHLSLGRMRKDPDLTVFVFKKAVILVYRESNKLKKKMTAPRLAHSHGDLDPFKFRWLIPLSALQVRLGNTTGTETTCIWELIHTKSELEGRPETVFQLCSSVPECKVNIIKVIRSILRENVRRNMRPAERGCKERLTPLRSTLPSSARIGSTRATWLCKQPMLDLPTPTSTLKPGQPDSDEGSLSSGNHSSSGAPPANGPTQPKTRPTRQAWSRGSLDSQRSSVSSSVKESDILSDEDDDEFSESGGRQEGQGSSPTSAIEAQFLSLRLSEEAASSRAPAPRVQPEGAEVDTPESPPKLVQGHLCPVKRKGSSSLRHSQGALLSLREHSRSLDSQTDVAAMDLNALLEREFSVQSLTSVVNEDCFYDPTDSSDTTDTTYTGSAPNAS
ncbi:T-lymphoma invasion and metastasis-inducing protein 2 [Salmo trutta]|uniref:T-lymphoma invasion and metastasis-inducing protein 2 n=1 Tax=Salmo trutta TaxID=8032 RepID=UPI001132268B|nr:T-lymphoma invasion and metastasis-inducing protein 2-like [Salmo trutta]